MITLTLTDSQYQLFVEAVESAKARDLKIREWTGETTEEIEARYQVPHDDILEDMADAYAQQYTGINMF